MANNNQISITIDPNDTAAIAAAVGVIQTKLPFLVALLNEERKALPKMGDKSVSFVAKALEHATANPTLVPPYINIAELQKDLDTVQELLKIYNPLKQICEGLDDTIMLAGSEAYTASLAFYNSVKGAVKNAVPMAKTIEEDLGARFPGRQSKAAKAKNEPSK